VSQGHVGNPLSRGSHDHGQKAQCGKVWPEPHLTRPKTHNSSTVVILFDTVAILFNTVYHTPLLPRSPSRLMTMLYRRQAHVCLPQLHHFSFFRLIRGRKRTRGRCTGDWPKYKCMSMVGNFSTTTFKTSMHETPLLLLH
jgi:hypothetical protein